MPRGFLAGTVEIVACEPLTSKHSQVAGFVIRDSAAGFAWLLRNPGWSNVS
jgi:hypothetical protein